MCEQRIWCNYLHTHPPTRALPTPSLPSRGIRHTHGHLSPPPSHPTFSAWCRHLLILNFVFISFHRRSKLKFFFLLRLGTDFLYSAYGANECAACASHFLSFKFQWHANFVFSLCDLFFCSSVQRRMGIWRKNGNETKEKINLMSLLFSFFFFFCCYLNRRSGARCRRVRASASCRAKRASCASARRANTAGCLTVSEPTTFSFSSRFSILFDFTWRFSRIAPVSPFFSVSVCLLLSNPLFSRLSEWDRECDPLCVDKD